ncbi:peptide-methionine (S)-S-oxide reductase [Flavobacterium silvaticum]|uniref:peptide-methionine (S)-S-oxide reductase n=1 Tax=Flavobacterium silvaticum TaxID=1852020 RepID=A0A972FNY6_9FLAO|nr:peptide-methionine (S)-S-oxide reductase [Flavobacterium silvaticum]NMH28735.1 peptide methionine sulfoxide reductase [Flavobacterium silvaticum]
MSQQSVPYSKIGFGGGCHWCTEAYFQSLAGVEKVEQGWIGSAIPDDAFSESVIVHYKPEVIPLEILIAVHLHTHASTKTHSLREKYRSAVYVFDGDIADMQRLIDQNQPDFSEPIITRSLPFVRFLGNIESQQDYYRKNKNGVFCQRYISPKLELIQKEFADYFRKS